MDEKQKKLIIVGAGIAGLSAGIYAQKMGYQTVIYEKNEIAGGNCSGWYKDGYAIDNCLHWLTGTAEGTGQFQLWQELGLWDTDVAIVKRKSFYVSEYEGKTITLWRDVQRTRKEMLLLSPEDAEEIHGFMDCVMVISDLMQSGMNPEHIIKAFMGNNDTILSHPKVIRSLMKYRNLNMQQWSQQFKHPLLQKMILDFTVKETESYWLIMSYSFFSQQNADIIEGGSLKLVRQLEELYRRAGGRILCRCAVEKILIEPSKRRADQVRGVLLENGSQEEADDVICACDIHYVYQQLLENRYTPKSLQKIYQEKKHYPTYSSFQVAFAVDGMMEEVDDTLSFDCTPFTVGHQNYQRIQVKNYRNYGTYIAPEGKTVIQCSLVQYEEDFRYWSRLHENVKEYTKTKNGIAQEIEKRIIARFPQYQGKIRLLDSWTPYTYAVRNHNYMGAYMRFLTTPFSSYGFLKREISGLEHIYLASHWLSYPGGVPTAAFMGKKAVLAIKEKET